MFLLTLSLCSCHSSVVIFGNPVIKPLDTGATGAFPASCVLKQPSLNGCAAGRGGGILGQPVAEFSGEHLWDNFHQFVMWGGE